MMIDDNMMIQIYLDSIYMDVVHDFEEAELISAYLYDDQWI